jgi:NTP pyrophosphatase (non-canonical NTP hydrolase)
MQDLINQVLNWADARKILDNSTTHAQLMKTMSELGELADAEIKHDRAGIIDGIGDVLVTLCIYSEMHDLNLDQCLASAYDVIKDRKGYLSPSGVFVKEES